MLLEPFEDIGILIDLASPSLELVIGMTHLGKGNASNHNFRYAQRKAVTYCKDPIGYLVKAANTLELCGCHLGDQLLSLPRGDFRYAPDVAMRPEQHF
jgi:hypothetical protein